MSTRRTLRFGLPVLALALVAAVPDTAEAQRRRSGRLVRPPVVVVHPTFPRWVRDPWYRWNQWGPYGYPYPPYRYGYLQDRLTASIRLEVDPREAQVYVDGYLAGVADQFDGIFQRLRLTPGPHEITIYLEGYRTIHESLYLSPRADRHLRFTMTPLPAGEVPERPPNPSDLGVTPPPPGPTAPGAGAPASPAAPQPRAEAPVHFGTLSLRIQPADAEIYIDDERWDTPGGGDRIAVQLAEGRHRLEVRKVGFGAYREDVLIRRGSTLSLNVSLPGQ